MPTDKLFTMGRREFLGTAAAVTAFSILPAKTVHAYEANSTIALGIIGTGGRGRWISRLFQEFAPFKVITLHDYFRDRVRQAAKDLQVPGEVCFTGLYGYKKLLEQPIDAIAVESPPYFHAEHVLAGLEAGKHVYLAKPVSVDVPSCLDVLSAAEKHVDKLCTLVDFQTRKDPLYQEAIKKVHEGAIGDPVLGQCYYHCGRLGTHAKPGTEVARLRNWVFDKALSGDIIVEQNIHVLDVANWMLKGHPLKATGTGGRKARVDVGDCWDHFVVTYEYADGVKVDFSGAQFINGFQDDLCMRLYGSLGTADTHYGGSVSIAGKKEEWPGGKTSNIYQDGAIANIKDFHAAIVNNKPFTNARDAVDSTLTAILGRMAAYTATTTTWEEMFKSGERLNPALNLPKDGPKTTA